MSQNSVNLLLIFASLVVSNPLPPGTSYWITNLGDKIIDNSGNHIIFNPGP